MVVGRIASSPCDERLQLGFDAILRNRRVDFSNTRFQTLPISFPRGPALLRGCEEEKQLLLESEYRPACDGTNVGATWDIFLTASRPGPCENDPSERGWGF